MATYLRDQYVGSVMNLSVTAPNGSIIYNWDKNFNNNYYGSYWFWNISLGENELLGDYVFEAVYENDVVSTTFSLVDCDYEQFYLVGYGIEGNVWSWENNVATITCNGDNVISGEVNLDASGDANFRFFSIPSDWSSGFNYPYFENLGYTIDSRLVNALDNDSNFKFIGDSGTYNLTVDMDLKTITLDNGLNTESFRDLELGLERNPVGDFIKLNPSEPLIAYKLYNVSGQVVKQGIFNKNYSIEVVDLIKGMYLLEVTASENKNVKQVRILK